MSKFDTRFGFLADYEPFNVSEHEQSSSPSRAFQNLSFSVGLHQPFKGKPRSKSNTAQLSPEGSFDYGRDKGYRFSLLAADEQGFYSPLSLGYGEAEAFGSEIPEAFRSPSTASSRQCAFDDCFGFDLDQSSSSTDINGDSGGDMGLAFPLTEPLGAEGTCDTVESSCDQQWEGVVELVHELTTRLGDSTGPLVNYGNEMVEEESGEDGDQQPPEFGSPSPTLNDPDVVSSNEIVKARCAGSPDEIMSALSAIQQNVEKMKAAVPRLANERHNFTLLVHRQAAAAAGAVKLISQLADAAVSIIPEMQLHVNQQVSPESCESSEDFNSPCENLPISSNSRVSSLQSLQEGENGESNEQVTTASMDHGSTPTSAAPVSVTSSNPATPASREFSGGESKISVTSASEFRPGAHECSSLVADLFEPGNAEAIKFPTSTASACLLDRLWSSDLGDVLGTGTRCPLGSESVPFGDYLPTVERGSSAASDEGPNTASLASSAAQEESDEGDTRGGEQLPAGSYTLMEIDDLEILNEQTHFCNICSKGFKRDANLRMHMRSHGGKFKSSSALIRSERPPKIAQEMVGGKPTRYSCPYVGCNRNMKHPKFQALKTMLCLKNHYRRSHCPKTLKCSICKTKQFSVVADLKTHEKHCGNDKWACSCGTTFSRKEKLYGHVSLFVGHIPVDATMALNVVSDVDISSLKRRDSAMNTVQHDYNASDEQQRLKLRNASAILWEEWENNTMYK